MKEEELPGWVRVKLPEEQTEELWEEIGSIKEFADLSDYSAQQLYNWKNKGLFLPIELVQDILEDFNLKALKGCNSSDPVKNPQFPLEISDELATRVRCSVSLSKDFSPVYRSNDPGLIKRFEKLLQRLGDVPTSLYTRSAFELRYPAFLHRLITERESRNDFAAELDEEGSFDDGLMVTETGKMPVAEFDGTLYSRKKKYRLAVKRKESESLKDLIDSTVESSRRLSQGI